MKYSVLLEVWADIEINYSVIERGLSPSFRSHFYNLRDADEVVEHIAYNLLHNNARLDQLDGFADMPAELAKIITQDAEITRVERGEEQP